MMGGGDSRFLLRVCFRARAGATWEILKIPIGGPTNLKGDISLFINGNK